MQPDRRGDTRYHYQRIAEELRWEIRDGRYEVGQRIPTQEQLQGRFRVSRETVRRALDELRKDGWIETKQGSGATVLPDERRTGRGHGRDDEEIRVAKDSPMVYLKPYLEAAFAAPKVTLDLFTLTAESLDTQVRTQVERIKDSESGQRPDSIAVRLMVPSLDIDLAVPCAVDEAQHDRVLERQRALIRRHVGSLCDALRDLRDRQIVPEVQVEARTVPFTPIMKLYVLNQREAFVGPYIVDKRTVRLIGGDAEILDVQGVGATLFRSVRDDDPQSLDSIVVTQWQQWFDSHWRFSARPETFGELT